MPFSCVYGLSAPACSHLTLKEEQLSFVKALHEGKDVLFGYLRDLGTSSLCYQILPFVFHHTPGLIGFGKRSAVLVISPLVSLMVDQVQKLRSRDTKTFISSSCTGIVAMLKSYWQPIQASSIIGSSSVHLNLS